MKNRPNILGWIILAAVAVMLLPSFIPQVPRLLPAAGTENGFWTIVFLALAYGFFGIKNSN